MYVHTNIHIIYTDAEYHAYIYMYMFVYTYDYAYISDYAHIYIYIYDCAHIYIYIYITVYIYIYISYHIPIPNIPNRTVTSQLRQACDMVAITATSLQNTSL